MFIIIPAIIAGLSFIGLAVIAARHWPQLRSLDVASLPETRDIEKKNIILEERLKRKLLGLWLLIWKPLRPWLSGLKDAVGRGYRFLLSREKALRQLSERFMFQQQARHDQAAVIEAKLEDAQVKDTHEASAEEKYLEVLALDPKNVEAYEGLGRIYLEQKDYSHAREVFEYLLKLSGESADYLLAIADCSRASGMNIEAFKTLEKAYKLEPKNPKIIDMLVETAILLKDKAMAKMYLKDLKDVNPENQKIAEFKEVLEKL